MPAAANLFGVPIQSGGPLVKTRWGRRVASSRTDAAELTSNAPTPATWLIEGVSSASGRMTAAQAAARLQADRDRSIAMAKTPTATSPITGKGLERTLVAYASTVCGPPGGVHSQ